MWIPRVWHLTLGVVCLTTASACHRIPATTPARATIWYVAAANVVRLQDSASRARDAYPGQGGLIVLDSASLRPSVVAPGGSGYVEPRVKDGFPGIGLERFATVTTYQGNRYHPETIRAIADDSLVLALAARAIGLSASRTGTQLILDFQGATPNDLPSMVAMVRAIATSARTMGRHRVAMVIPPGDTISYPTVVLARVADLLVLRLHGEHRPGAAPGPLATPEFIAREIGMRAREIGANRLIAELPLYGYRWNRDGSAQPITFAEAQALVVSEAGVFRRDPASHFLTATGRDGWTVWIPDASTVEAMIVAVRRRGVNEIALAGATGSDPDIPDRVATVIKR